MRWKGFLNWDCWHFLAMNLLIFLIPLQTRYLFTDPMINGAPWEDGRIALYAFDIVFVIAFIFSRVIWRRGSSRRWTLFLILGISILLSLTHAHDISIVLYRFARVVQGMLVFGMLVRAVPWERIQYLAMFVLSGMIQSLIGVVQFSTQSFPANKWFGLAGLDPSILGTVVIENDAMRVLRAYGTFPHPNTLAGFLVVGIFVSLILYRESRSSRMRLFALSGFLIQQVGLFFTFSRSGILAFGIGLFVVITYQLYTWSKIQEVPLRKLWRSPALLLVIIVMWVGLASQFYDLVVPRVTVETRIEQQSLHEREESILDALSLWGRHPWVGHGVGHATDEAHQMYPTKSAYELEPPHNMIVLLLLEIGLLGFLAAAILYSSLFWSTLFGGRVRPLFFGGLIAVFFLGMLDHYLWTQASGVLLFWVALVFFQPLITVDKNL